MEELEELVREVGRVSGRPVAMCVINRKLYVATEEGVVYELDVSGVFPELEELR